MTALQSEFWKHCNILSLKSVSDVKRELQKSNLLLKKAFARRTDGLRSRRGVNSVKVSCKNSGRLCDTWSERDKLESNTTPGFYPTAIKGCRGIVFTHGVRMGGWVGGGKKIVQAVSQKL